MERETSSGERQRQEGAAAGRPAGGEAPAQAPALATRLGRLDTGTRNRVLTQLQRTHGNTLVQRLAAPTAPRRLLLRNNGHGTQQAAEQGVSFSFSVRVERVLSPDELQLQFIRQYRGAESDEAARRIRDEEGWRWTGDPPAVTDAHVRRGYLLIRVRDLRLRRGTATEARERRQYFGGLSAGDQAALNAETDRQFWERTQYRVGQRLGQSADDRAQAQYWMVLRNELIRQRQAIEALPPDVRAVLFSDGPGPAVQPRDYESVLRIAQKLQTLSPAQLADYRARTTAQTRDWAEFERSVDRYLAEQAQRREAAHERERIKTRLVGLDAIYRRYRLYMSMLTTSAVGASMGPHGAGAALGSQRTLNRMREELDADVRSHGFDGIDDFERTIRQYERAFAEETRALARVLLDRYAHILYEQERLYRDPAHATDLATRLGRTQARQHYERAERIRDEHASVPWTPEEMAEQSYWVGQRNEALQRADAEVRSVATEHPLVARRDFDRERLARADQAQVQSIMLGYIRARQSDIAETRRNLDAKPNLIFKLDTLLAASYQAQGIQSPSLFDSIIRDHIRDLNIRDAIPNIVLAVIAIAAGLLTAGGGTVAVLAAGTALGIGAYGVIDEFRRYEMQSAAAGAGLLSDDPSMGWVILALVGAGLDLAAVAAAARAVRPAAQAFNATHDLARLDETLRGLAEVNDAMRASLVRAARAEQQYRQALRGLVASSAQLNAVLIPGAEQFARLMVAAYYLAKRGVIAFEIYLQELRAARLISRIEDLSPEQLQTLRRAFLEGVERSRTGLMHYDSLSEQIRRVFSREQVEEIAARGKTFGMSDDQIRDFLEMGSIAKPNRRPPKLPLTPAEVQQQMENWATVVRPRGFPYRFADAAQFENFVDDVRALVREFRMPEGRIVVQGSSLRTPAARDIDIAIFVSDAEFASYAARCRAGILSRARNRGAAQRIVEQLDEYVERGFIPKFLIDRTNPRVGFAEEAHFLLERPYGVDIDFSVMKSSSSVALYPSLDVGATVVR